MLIEISEFDLELASLKFNVVIEPDCLFGVKHGVEGLKVGDSFGVVGMEAVLRPHLERAGIVEGGLQLWFLAHTILAHSVDIGSVGFLADGAIAH
jgi:hypothetical protein